MPMYGSSCAIRVLWSVVSKVKWHTPYPNDRDLLIHLRQLFINNAGESCFSAVSSWMVCRLERAVEIAWFKMDLRQMKNRSPPPHPPISFDKTDKWGTVYFFKLLGSILCWVLIYIWSVFKLKSWDCETEFFVMQIDFRCEASRWWWGCYHMR